MSYRALRIRVQCVSPFERIPVEFEVVVAGIVTVTGSAKVCPSGPNSTMGPAETSPSGGAIGNVDGSTARRVIITGLESAPGGIVIAAPMAGPAVSVRVPPAGPTMAA